MIEALMALLGAPFVQFLLTIIVGSVVVTWLLEWSFREGWDDDFFDRK